MSYGYHLCSGIDQLFELVEQQFATIVDRRHAQPPALLLTKHLPGNDVRMMLHGRDEDFVPSADVSAAIGLRNQVDSLGRTANEDDLFRPSCIHELLYGLACCFMLFCRML